MQHPHLSALLPASYPKRLDLDMATVWDSLFIYWLLNDARERDCALELLHNVPHAERLNEALKERNLRMVGPGQEQWNHACDVCCWVDEQEDGSTSGELQSLQIFYCCSRTVITKDLCGQ